MRQLNYITTGTLEWHDVPAPRLPSDKAALVRPLVVSTCDRDGGVISGLVRFRGPVPVGHEGVGEITDVGDAVKNFRPGDRVIMPWKISCGECAKCQMGLTAHCQSVPHEAAYGWGPTAREWGGFLADLVAVPWADHMLCPLPDGLDPLAASGLGDNITDAWRAVGPQLAERPGGHVLVAGGGGPGSIGLFAAGLAHALEAGEIVYLDPSPERRALAAELYCAEIWDGSEGLLDELDAGFDVTVDASGNPEMLGYALAHTGANGTCTSTSASVYAGADVPIPALHMFRWDVTLKTGWVHTRPLMGDPLALIVEGKFDPRAVTTAVVEFDQAAEALAQPFTKLVMTNGEAGT
jgi:threonine dehydrogenase-like Zn-dependent dehydrogenase